MREDGVPHPADLDRPRLQHKDLPVYDAFRVLGGSRGFNEVGPQPITLAEIAAYAHLSGVKPNFERMRFLRLIKAMDRIEMTYHAEKRAKK